MLYRTGTLTARSLQGFRANRLRLVRAVALAIGISLFLPMEQVSQASIVPIKSPKDYARSLLSKEEFRCLNKLYSKESAWNPKAVGNLNGTHRVYGIPQGKSEYLRTADPIAQVNWGLRYIKHRYSGSACNAWSHFKRKGWH